MLSQLRQPRSSTPPSKPSSPPPTPNQSASKKIIGDPGSIVSGDTGRLQQVVWNLLSNAIKFTPKEGKVQVIAERVDSHLEISVADTGQGITPQFLRHRLRALQAGGCLHHPKLWRARNWAGYRQASCRATRRNRPRRQPGEAAAAPSPCAFPSLRSIAGISLRQPRPI